MRGPPGSAFSVTCVQELAQPPSPAPVLPYSSHPGELESACDPGFMSSQAPTHTQGLLWCECRTQSGTSRSVTMALHLGKTQPRVQSVTRCTGPARVPGPACLDGTSGSHLHE